jgi:hypothetical protein
MKSLRYFSQLILFLAFLGVAPIALNAQEKAADKAAAVNRLIQDQQYTFHAQYALPASGRQRYLTTDYTVDVSRDTVVSDLPFFGRAYSAPIDPAEGGIKFTSTNFEYNLTERKKGGWDIAIRPKDVNGAQQLMLRVYDNGTASLQVNSSNRQSISFNGYVSGRGSKR